jgi:hypothetical protein
MDDPLSYLGTHFKIYLDETINKEVGLLQNIPGFNEDEYRHVSNGLNCLYGVELEFLHIGISNINKPSSDLIIGNKVNNCIYNQNSSEFLKYNFDAMSPVPILGQQYLQNMTPLKGINSIQNNNNKLPQYDQWSNFLLEVTKTYHSHTHSGIPFKNNNSRGNSGSKIEVDGTVGPRHWFNHYADSDNDKLIIWKNRRLNRNNPIITAINSSSEGKQSINFDIEVINLRSLRRIINDNDDTSRNGYNNSKIIGHTELVSPILTNELFKLNNIYVPFGFVLLDNVISHFKSHSNIILVQNEGLHIHISKNPRTNTNPKITIDEAAGFCKLFWLFEPLFAAGQPTYRSNGVIPGYQSIQSIFSYNDITTYTNQEIYNVLTTQYSHPGGTQALFGFATIGNRRVRPYDKHDTRYLSCNFMNLVQGGIGTIEFRMGHSTFDSKAVQLYIHLLQVLFQFNLFLLETDPSYHNSIITHCANKGSIPYYCDDITNNTYSKFPKNGYINPANKGNPIYGFLTSFEGHVGRTNLIISLLNDFPTMTGAYEGIKEYVKLINLYHGGSGGITAGYPNICDSLIGPLDFNFYNNSWFDPSKIINFKYFIMKNIDDDDDDQTIIFYDNNNNTSNNSLNHQCSTCSTNSSDNSCANLYPDPVTFKQKVRKNIYDLNDVKNIFLDQPDGEWQKTQTELLNFKFSDGYQSGGKNKLKSKKMNKKKLNTKKNNTKKNNTKKNNTKKNNTKKNNTKKNNTKKMSNGGNSILQDNTLLSLPNKKIISSPTPYIFKNLKKIPIKYIEEKEEVRQYIDYNTPLNKGFDVYYNIIKDKLGKVIMYYDKNEDKKMTEVSNELINKQLLNFNELYTLTKYNYIQPDLFLNNNIDNKSQLLSELNYLHLDNTNDKIVNDQEKINNDTKIVIDKEKLDQIINIYTNVYKQ